MMLPFTPQGSTYVLIPELDRKSMSGSLAGGTREQLTQFSKKPS